MKDREAWRAAVHGVANSMTWLCNGTTVVKRRSKYIFLVHHHQGNSVTEIKDVADYNHPRIVMVEGLGYWGRQWGNVGAGSEKLLQRKSWQDSVSTWASLVAQLVKNPPVMWETWVGSLGWEDPLEKWTAIQSSILAWRTPWTTVHGVENSRTTLGNFHFLFINGMNEREVRNGS